MPKFGTHILIGELAATRRPDLFGGVPPNNALRLGAIGPDLTLFILDPITNPDVRLAFDSAIDVLSRIRAIKTRLNDLISIFDGPVADLQDWVTGGLSRDLTALLEAGLETMVLALKLGVAHGASPINLQNPLARLIALGQFDPTLLSNPANAVPTFVINSADNYGFPFRYFGHPFTDDGLWKAPEPVGDYSRWWWMDMLHYRETGKFARSLLKNADSPLLRSYALGYLSHVAGDICGHPFINAIVEGPFRNHAYRHIVLEGLADTWLWQQQGRGDILQSELHKQCELDPAEVADVGHLIVRSLMDTYRPPLLPTLLPGGYPSANEVIAAYQRMLVYLDLSTSGGAKRPTPPPDTPADLLQEIQDLLKRNNPGPPPPWNPNDPMRSILAVLGWLLRGVVLIAMIATLPTAVLLRFVNLAPRWLLYLIHMAVYAILSGLRTLLALLGWGYASSEDFDTFGFLEDWVRVGGSVQESYPRRGIPLPKPPYYWLLPPHVASGVETQGTAVGPIPGGAMPDWIVSPLNAMHGDLGVLQRLNAAVDPSETRNLVREFAKAGTGGFGNAVDFLIAMLDGKLPVPNLDLDGDRGYAFRSWEVLPPNERYV